tara:strand:- start:105 stop:476 length:372 start_codon:yes stop_codon:yes gene_type:complete
MILESISILYYTLATLSIGLVLYQKYNIQIHTCINKWLYNYTPVPNEESDLNLQENLNNDNTYVLFNDLENNHNDDNENNNDENDLQNINNNNVNENDLENNNNDETNNLFIKTKKNVVIDFE